MVLNDIQEKVRSHKAEMGFEGWKIRLAILCEKIERLEDELFERKARWDEQKQNPKMEPYRKMNEAHMKAISHLLVKTRRELKYVINTLEEIYGEKKPTQRDGITDDMIERARNYPIENLLDIKRGMANCISGTHQDKTPSMDARNNFCHCYACGWGGDGIDVYMKLNGSDFITAVKALQ